MQERNFLREEFYVSFVFPHLRISRRDAAHQLIHAALDDGLGARVDGIVLGCVLGALWPQAACLAPLGTIFINLMFCIVVPLVFCSLAGSIACMKSPRRAGKIMGTTLLVFVVTGLIASAIMVVLMRLYPPVLKPVSWSECLQRKSRCRAP